MLLVLLGACNPVPGPEFKGNVMSDYFPLDGHRSAVYTSEDDTITWKLRMEKVEPTQIVDEREVVTLEYYDADEGGNLLGSVAWSSPAGDAVWIHGWSSGAGAMVTFDPPLAITDSDDRMRVQDSVESTTTDSNGASLTVTSSFVESVPECPTLYTDKWTDCILFRIDDGDGDDLSGPIFAGDYTLVTSYGPAYLLTTGYTQEWNLTKYEYSSDD